MIECKYDNNIKCIVTRDNKVEIHTFTIIDDSSRSNQIRSIMAFLHRELDCALQARNKNIKLSINSEIVFPENWYQYPYNHDMPTVHHDSIWDLYQEINYDIKQKKYK